MKTFTKLLTLNLALFLTMNLTAASNNLAADHLNTTTLDIPVETSTFAISPVFDAEENDPRYCFEEVEGSFASGGMLIKVKYNVAYNCGTDLDFFFDSIRPFTSPRR